MRNVLFVCGALCVAVALAGCQRKPATVENKPISDLRLADVRPIEAASPGGVTIGPTQGLIVGVGPTQRRDVSTQGVKPRPAPPQPDTVTVIRPSGPANMPPMHYTVAKGDSLTALSRRFYGDESMVKAIFAANRKVLKSPDLIKVGQKLYLPTKGGGIQMVSHTGPVPFAAEDLRPQPARPTTYKVKKGDSLFKIAKQVYGRGSQWPKIYEANKAKIKNPDRVREGVVLTIPG